MTYAIIAVLIVAAVLLFVASAKSKSSDAEAPALAVGGFICLAIASTLVMGLVRA